MPPKRITTTDLPKNPDTQPFLDHPATQALDKKSAHAESGGLLPALISLKKRYESVRFKNGDKVTTWSTADIFHLLYSYIINRALAIATIEDDGYILRHSFDSKTDDAFLHFVDALVHAEEGLERSSSRPGKTIVTIDETEKAGRAFKVIRDQPFKFTVQQKDGQGLLGPEEAALFWFTPSTQIRGAWDMARDYMSKSYAVCFYNDENYEWRGDQPDK